MYTFVFVYQGKNKPLRMFRFMYYGQATVFCAYLMKRKQNAFVLSRFYRWSKHTAVYRNTMFYRTSVFSLNPYETSEEYYYLSPKKYDDLIDMSEQISLSELNSFCEKVDNV